MDAKIWLFNYYAMSGEYASAKELVNQLLERDPLFFPARMCLGDILRLEGDIDGAIREQESSWNRIPGTSTPPKSWPGRISTGTTFPPRAGVSRVFLPMSNRDSKLN